MEARSSCGASYGAAEVFPERELPPFISFSLGILILSSRVCSSHSQLVRAVSLDFRLWRRSARKELVEGSQLLWCQLRKEELAHNSVILPERELPPFVSFSLGWYIFFLGNVTVSILLFWRELSSLLFSQLTGESCEPRFLSLAKTWKPVSQLFSQLTGESCGRAKEKSVFLLLYQNFLYLSKTRTFNRFWRIWGPGRPIGESFYGKSCQIQQILAHMVKNFEQNGKF